MYPLLVDYIKKKEEKKKISSLVNSFTKPYYTYLTDTNSI